MNSISEAKSDPLLALVAEVMAEILHAEPVVTPLEVLLRLELLDPDLVEKWRSGELPYLERGITTGLARVARFLRLIAEQAKILGLQPTPGKYLRRGKGPKRKLRFSKRGDLESELAYSTHFTRV
ncbi:MAG TPA: hypothetical protein VG937_26115 [Polyangiaceae bacterium]|jgi:hypothetical protein|nr:hypothetical protein [Polyangiaceae bacterium]